jgi:hypothetical protein
MRGHRCLIATLVAFAVSTAGCTGSGATPLPSAPPGATPTLTAGPTTGGTTGPSGTPAGTATAGPTAPPSSSLSGPVVAWGGHCCGQTNVPAGLTGV